MPGSWGSTEQTFFAFDWIKYKWFWPRDIANNADCQACMAKYPKHGKKNLEDGNLIVTESETLFLSIVLVNTSTE